MRINKISAIPFSSIQIQNSKMNRAQRDASERLASTIEYSDWYTQIERNYDNDIDIYMLAAPYNKVEIRLLDPYSGNFIKNKRGNIISILMGTRRGINYEAKTNNILDYYEKIETGKIKRPEVDVDKYMNKDVDVAKINPEAHKDLLPEIAWQMKSNGYTYQEAKEEAYNIFASSYSDYNSDGVF